VQGGRTLARARHGFLETSPTRGRSLRVGLRLCEDASQGDDGREHIPGGLGVSAEAAARRYLVRAGDGRLAVGTLVPARRTLAETSRRRKEIGETMDFSRVQLSDDDRDLTDEARDFLRTHVTEGVLSP